MVATPLSRPKPVIGPYEAVRLEEHASAGTEITAGRISSMQPNSTQNGTGKGSALAVQDLKVDLEKVDKSAQKNLESGRSKGFESTSLARVSFLDQ